jgi:uncharacterized phiE125 gp8 family phage protein
MSAILLNAPAVEPVTLEDAKQFLRVEHDDDDDVIAALIAGARIHIEAQTRRALITQSWRLVRDAWPADGRIAVRPSPLQSLDVVRLYDDDGEAAVLDLQGFIADTANAALVFAPWSPAQPGRAAAGIELDVTCGYGDDPDDVPEPLRQAIRMIVAHWYDNRGLAAVGQAVAMLPAGVATLVSPYREVAL